eukprot:CAMPEP_0167786546 /NCGR_PEP_ID=MMETSP0111_2-20121227/8860_1 /TAXON_ID=91324 /ORGANISM="Lotharella globosa, Strain CCCM811" /LENGTH=289 /DNA_ID=CAMNT_0007677955 /DNA_START=343 /DNA_END=1215 /DNA_ORIENTATION=-
MYILFVFKDPRQDPLIFEAEKVALWMTNNAGDTDTVKPEEVYVKDLISRDMVQIHAMRWFALNSSNMESVRNMDFTVWPNNPGIESMEALCFSRWNRNGGKKEDSYKLLSQRFVLRYYEIRRHVREYVLTNTPTANKRREIVFNPSLNFAIWLSKINGPRGGEVRMTSVMLCIPKADLTRWTPEAHFNSRLSVEKVSHFQMILWKDLASRAREKNPESKQDMKSGLVSDGLGDRTRPPGGVGSHAGGGDSNGRVPMAQMARAHHATTRGTRGATLLGPGSGGGLRGLSR